MREANICLTTLIDDLSYAQLSIALGEVDITQLPF